MVRASDIGSALLLAVLATAAPAMGAPARAARKPSCPTATTPKQRLECLSEQRRLLSSTDPREIAEACSVIGDLRLEESLPDLGAILSASAAPDVQAKCAYAAGRIGTADASVLLRTVATDRTRDETARAAAIRARALIEGGDTRYLIGLLDDSSQRIRGEAAYALCQLRVPDAVPGIRSMLASTDPAVRQSALTAASIWPEAFRSELLQVATRAGNAQENNIEALTALSTLSDGLPANDQRRIAELLEPNQSPDVRAAARQVLSQTPVGREIFSTARIDNLMPDRQLRVTLGSDAPAKGAPEFHGRWLLAASAGLAACVPLLAAMIQVSLRRRKKAPLQSAAPVAERNVRALDPGPPGGADWLRLFVPALALTAAYAVLWIIGLQASGTGLLPYSRTLEIVAMGAVGAYLSTVVAVLNRVSRNDLRDSVLWDAMSALTLTVAVSLALAQLGAGATRLPGLAALIAGALAPFALKQALLRLRSKTAEAKDSASDTSLDLVSGIGRRQKERLREEEIETMQHLATVDPRDLITRTPYAIATLVDWIDQAVLFSKFSSDAGPRLRKAGLPVSAVELSLAAPAAPESEGKLERAATAMDLAPEVLRDRLNSLYHDAQVRKLVELSERTDKWRWSASSPSGVSAGALEGPTSSPGAPAP